MSPRAKLEMQMTLLAKETELLCKEPFSVGPANVWSTPPGFMLRDSVGLPYKWSVPPLPAHGT